MSLRKRLSILAVGFLFASALWADAFHKHPPTQKPCSVCAHSQVPRFIKRAPEPLEPQRHEEALSFPVLLSGGVYLLSLSNSRGPPRLGASKDNGTLNFAP